MKFKTDNKCWSNFVSERSIVMSCSLGEQNIYRKLIQASKANGSYTDETCFGRNYVDKHI